VGKQAAQAKKAYWQKKINFKKSSSIKSII